MASLTDIFSAMQNGVTALNGLTKQLTTFFPQAGGVSSTVTVGSVTFNSSQAVAFFSIVSSSGYTYKVPLYNP